MGECIQPSLRAVLVRNLSFTFTVALASLRAMCVCMREPRHNQMQRIHGAFKEHVVAHRPLLATRIDEVMEGDSWLGVECVGLGLADAVECSDVYLGRYLGRDPDDDSQPTNPAGSAAESGQQHQVKSNASAIPVVLVKHIHRKPGFPWGKKAPPQLFATPESSLLSGSGGDSGVCEGGTGGVLGAVLEACGIGAWLRRSLVAAAEGVLQGGVRHGGELGYGSNLEGPRSYSHATAAGNGVGPMELGSGASGLWSWGALGSSRSPRPGKR